MKYHLRDIPDDLWVRVKQRCHGEGRTIRFVIVALLQRYADVGLEAMLRTTDRARPARHSYK